MVSGDAIGFCFHTGELVHTLSAPNVRFTSSGDISIAYQVVGDGPIDVVYAPGWLSNIEIMWEHPPYVDLLEGLSRFCRLILFDKRGTGLSDRGVGAPTLEQRAEDIRAVMDASGSKEAVLFGVSEGGNMATMFAATYPERTISVVLFGCFARLAWDEGYEAGETLTDFRARLKTIEANWGKPFDLSTLAPSVAHDTAARNWVGRFFRNSASLSSALKITELNYWIDIREVLPSISCPTLILHREGDKSVPVEYGRDLAARIAGAKLVELPGEDHLPWYGNRDEVIVPIEEFVTGRRIVRPTLRVLMTVLFTDIVASTEIASKLGDQAWKDLLDRHDSIVRRLVDTCEGTLVKTTGDGMLASFNGPTRAIHCAVACRRELTGIGLPMRAGIHTGECERREHDISGLAVHIASRVLDEADPRKILVSNTVKDLTVGSGLHFESAGQRELRGVPGAWHLYEVVEEESPLESLNRVVSLKPSFFGFGLNLNEVVDLWLKKRREKR